jgi:hypothetical protein
MSNTTSVISTAPLTDLDPEFGSLAATDPDLHALLDGAIVSALDSCPGCVLSST